MQQVRSGRSSSPRVPELETGDAFWTAPRVVRRCAVAAGVALGLALSLACGGKIEERPFSGGGGYSGTGGTAGASGVAGRSGTGGSGGIGGHPGPGGYGGVSGASGWGGGGRGGWGGAGGVAGRGGAGATGGWAGAGATGGWAGAGGMTQCDYTGDCEGCQTCAVEGPCWNALNACQSNQDCQDFVACIESCTDDACFEACISHHEEGAQLYTDLVLCALCDQCYNDCDGAAIGCPSSECDNSGNCDTCIQCALSGDCSDEASACFDSIDCNEYIDCLEPCTDEACFAKCDEQYPTGSAIYADLVMCAICVECFTDCEGVDVGCLYR